MTGIYVKSSKVDVLETSILIHKLPLCALWCCPNWRIFLFLCVRLIGFYKAINQRCHCAKIPRDRDLSKIFFFLFHFPSKQSIVKQQRHMVNANFLFVLQRLLFLWIWNPSSWKNRQKKNVVLHPKTNLMLITR